MKNILHISDIHFGWEYNDKCNNKSDIANRKVCLDSMLTEISKLDKKWKPTIICISGDIGWKGIKTDYEEAQKFIENLLCVCGLDFNNIIVCPGNHDVIRTVAEKNARPTTSKEADEVLTPPIGDQFYYPFSGFIEFCKRSNFPILTFGDSDSHLVGQRILNGVRFVVLNTAWFSKDDTDVGKLWLGFPHLRYMEGHGQLPQLQFDGKELITVALMHHPPDVLHTEDRHTYSLRPNPLDYLARRCHILLTGHTHGEVRKADRIAEGAWHFTSGATFAGASYFNNFRILQVTKDFILYKSYEFDPRSTDNKWKSSDARILSTLKESKVRRPVKSTKINLEQMRKTLNIHAERILEQKSRYLKPSGNLPKTVSLEVSVVVSPQISKFDPKGRMIRVEGRERLMSIYDSARLSRRTLLLGDLGTGKSTIAAQLIIETMGRSKNSAAFMISAKNLQFESTFTQTEFIAIIDKYIVEEIFPANANFRLSSLLEKHIEVLLIMDGLDELQHVIAARVLKQMSILPENWPTIQVVVTARPIELARVSFSGWQIVHTIPLDDNLKRMFFRAELVADDFPSNIVAFKVESLIESLKDLPALNSVANSPLAIRLIYPTLISCTSEVSSLGELLFKLLQERISEWHKRDGKPSSFENFEKIAPSTEKKIELLAVIAKRLIRGERITSEKAKEILTEQLYSEQVADKYLVAEEALSFYEWLGFFIKGEVIEFPLQPLAEIISAFHQFLIWKSQKETWTIPDVAEWRVVSFSAGIARRYGKLEDLKGAYLEFIRSLLRKTKNLSAACYIVEEAADTKLAINTIQEFRNIGYRPITIFYDEKHTSTRNIAKTIWLAGEEGFNWLYDEYLDPRYPFPNHENETIKVIFREWAWLIHHTLTDRQKSSLIKLIQPHLVTDDRNYSEVLNTLAVLVPEGFSEEDRLWYQSNLMEDPFFGDWVYERLKNSGKSLRTKHIVNKILLYHADHNITCGLLWFELNSASKNVMNPQLIRLAFRSIVVRKKDPLAEKFIELYRKKMGDEQWIRLARWLLAVGDNRVATGAAITLFQNGENKITMLGKTLIKATHEMSYIAEAEEILNSLIESEGTEGIRWLAIQMSMDDFGYDSHSGCWRILLSKIDKVEDGPYLFGECISKVGGHLLTCSPEIRDSFFQLLNGSRGEQFRNVLRRLLYSMDPMRRKCASMVLVIISPQTEAEALFVVIKSFENYSSSSDGAWLYLYSSLSFGFSVLNYIKSKLNILSKRSRTLALILLIKGGIEIDDETRRELLTTTLPYHIYFYQPPDSFLRSVFESEEYYDFLLSLLRRRDLELSSKAAEILLELCKERLTPLDKAICLVITTESSVGVRKLVEIMAQIATDSSFAELISLACNEVARKGGATPFLELVLKANKEPSTWENVVCAMVYVDTGMWGGNFEEIWGQTLLEYGYLVEKHRLYIGKAASKCLEDPRIKDHFFEIAYHWLAIIADEFVKLKPSDLKNAICHGEHIYDSAVAPLIARLGEVPTDFRGQRETRISQEQYNEEFYSEENRDKALEKLMEYSRNSDKLHSGLLKVIEQVLLFEDLDLDILKRLPSIGKPGILINLALRYSFGIPPKLTESVPLLEVWANVWARDENTPVESVRHISKLVVSVPSFWDPVENLRNIWEIVRSSVFRYDSHATQGYLEFIDRMLIDGKKWILPLAIEILELRGYLLNDQIPVVLLEYAQIPSFFHNRLLGLIVQWVNEDHGETITGKILECTNIYIGIQNETQWDVSGNGHNNVWANLLFPIIKWTKEGKSSAEAESVFLRGLKSSFNAIHVTSNTLFSVNIVELLSVLEPLIHRIPSEILSSAIQKGVDSHDPAVRAFCFIIRAFKDNE